MAGDEVKEETKEDVKAEEGTGDKATGDKATGDKATGDKATGDKATGDKAEVFKTALIEIIGKKYKDDNGNVVKGKALKAQRDADIAELFEARLQEMLIDSMMEDMGKAHEMGEAELRELQTRMEKAKSSKDMMKWPVPNMENAWTIQNFVDDLMVKGKKAADETSEMAGVVMKGVTAQVKALVAVAELMDTLLSTAKKEILQLLQDDLPAMIKLRVLKYVANEQKEVGEATDKLTDDLIPTAVARVRKGVDALKKGGTKQKRKRRQRTQRYRAKFLASDFF